MKDKSKSKDKLIEELTNLRQKIKGLEKIKNKQKRIEQELKEDSSITQKYLDITGVMLVGINSEGTVTLINKKGCSVLGYSKEEIIGKNWFDNFLPERIRKEVKKVSNILLAGEMEPVEYYENPVLTKSGEERIIAWSNTLLKDSSGKITGHLSSGEDITEQKQMEKIIKKEREQLLFTQFSMDNSGIASFWINKNADIFYANNTACKKLGYTSEELLKMKVSDIDPDFPAESWSSHWKELKRKKTLTFESRHLTKRGKIIPVEITANFLEYNGKEYNCAFAKDITKRKKTEESLRSSEGMYRTLVENTDDIIFLVDREFKVLSINTAAARLFRKDKKYITGKRIHNLFPEDIANQFIKSLEEVFKSGSKLTRESPLSISNTDNKIWILSTLNPIINDDGNIYAILGVSKNITLRKKMEDQIRQSQKMEAIGQLSAGIAHQLNTPLAVISTRLQTLKNDLLISGCNTQTDKIDNMITNIDRMANIIRNLLTFSRHSSSNMEKVLIHDLIKETLSFVEIKAIEKKITIINNTKNGHPYLTVDKNKIIHVFMNILMNGFDSMPDGGRLTITSKKITEKNIDYIQLNFSDTGKGMNPETITSLFNPFFTTKPQGEGTGLGMSICYRLIEEHNGKIQVESKPGRGSKIKVLIPIEADVN